MMVRHAIGSRVNRQIIKARTGIANFFVHKVRYPNVYTFRA